MQITIHGVNVECVQGSIASQHAFDAVVNAANAQLMPGGGVAGIIHRAAGPSLAVECRGLAPITPGQAVITAAYELPNKHVIHCLGPRYEKDVPSAVLLAACYRNALLLSEQHHLISIAFPAISTGAFAYPVEEAADVAMRTVGDVIPTLQSIRHIRFVLVGKQSYRAHTNAMKRVFPSCE